jgi:ribonuclease P protein subunit POP4
MKLPTTSKFDLIGQDVIITNSNNKEIVGITGKVIMETKNTITLDTQDGEKNIPKDVCQFSNNEGVINTDATKLSKRPYERMEMLV